jgi:hypothetical protein
MLVENESNWQTEDLEALLKSVMEQPEFKLDYGVHDSTLILFSTSCRKSKKPSYDDEIVKQPDAAEYDARPRRYDDTRVIKIRSAKQLEMELLDKLAHIGECVQHMNTTNVVVLAKAIWVCIGRAYWVKDDQVEFAKSMNMRLRSKVTRSKVAVEREITALDWQQNSIQNDANRKIRKLEEKAADLRNRLRNMA